MWLLTESTAKPLDQPVMIIGLLAAMCIIIAFSPQSWVIYKTRNTLGINLNMFFLNLFVSIGFGSWSVVSVITNFSNGGYPVPLSHAVCNVVVFTLSLFILMHKLRNIANSKKLNISEEEYWNKHVLPTLTLNKS